MVLADLVASSFDYIMGFGGMQKSVCFIMLIYFTLLMHEGAARAGKSSFLR